MPKSNGPSKSKPKKGKLIYYKAPHISNENVVKHRYTMFAADGHGGVSQRSSMLKTALPSSLVQAGPSEDIANSRSIGNIPETNDEPHDTAYIDYLEELGANAKARRIREQGVSLGLRSICFDTSSHQRIGRASPKLHSTDRSLFGRDRVIRGPRRVG